MASKWLKDKQELFNQFKEEKKKEAEQNTPGGPRRQDIVWKTPEKGTQEKPKTYVVRFLTDPRGNFYKKLYYHMFKSNSGKWEFVLCPKTHDFTNYCPVCAATYKLYQGSSEDKAAAKNYKRKEKFCGNIYVVKDPRDADAGSEDEKNTGKVLVYEFPSKLEQKVKSEMTDEEYGNGLNIFDPGEDGIDFLIKVGATKPGPDSQSFHDYSESKFTNKPYALAKTDDEIEKILNSTYDLDEYINNMARDEEAILSLLKDEMLWELIESDYNKGKNQKPGRNRVDSTSDMDDTELTNPSPSNGSGEQGQYEPKQKTEEGDNPSEGEDISDQDLLDELDNL